MGRLFRITFIFLTGFIVGAVTLSSFTVPARKAYREILQRNYILDQDNRATTALSEGNNIEALVHLQNEIDAGPMDGSKLFNNEMVQEIDRKYWFHSLPEVNKKINDLIYILPGSEEKIKGMLHGKIAVILESLGQPGAAKQHWQQVSILLHIPEKNARVKFVKLIKNMMRNNMKKTVE